MCAFHSSLVGWSKLWINLSLLTSTTITVLTLLTPTCCFIFKRRHIQIQMTSARGHEYNTQDTWLKKMAYLRVFVKINCYYNLSSDQYQTSHQQAQSSAITTELTAEGRFVGGRFLGGLIYLPPPSRRQTHEGETLLLCLRPVKPDCFQVNKLWWRAAGLFGAPL